MFKLSSGCVSNGEGTNPEALAIVAREIISFTDDFNFDPCIVTGGFVNQGRHQMNELGLDISDVDDRAFAAKGMGQVQNAWDEAFKEHQTGTGLVAVTHREIDDLGDPGHEEHGEIRKIVTVDEITSGAIREHVITEGKQSKNGGIVSKLEEGANLVNAGIKAFIGNYLDSYFKIYTGQSGTQVIQ